MNIEDWIVRSKKNLKVGDIVTPIRNNGNEPLKRIGTVMGEVVSITSAYVELSWEGERFFSYAGTAYAVKPPVVHDH